MSKKLNKILPLVDEIYDICEKACIDEAKESYKDLKDKVHKAKNLKDGLGYLAFFLKGTAYICASEPNGIDGIPEKVRAIYDNLSNDDRIKLFVISQCIGNKSQ